MGILKDAFLYCKDFCEDTAENIKETVTAAVDTAKLQYRIVSQRNEINVMYAALGKSVAFEEKTADDEDVVRLKTRIAVKEELLDGLEKQLRIVSGKVICPDCGRFMSAKYTYCPYCGKLAGVLIDDGEADVTGEELLDIREIDKI